MSVCEENVPKLKYLKAKVQNVRGQEVSCQKSGPMMVVVCDGMKKLDRVF